MQIELNKDLIANFLETKFPNADIRFFGEGWTSTAFAVNDEIFRFPKTEPVLKRYEREIRILSMVRPFTDTPIPDPRMIMDEVFPYVVHKLLPGVHWSVSEFDSMSPELQDCLVKDCAAFLFQLHSIDLKAAKKIVAETKIGKTITEPVSKEEIKAIIGDRIAPNTLDYIYDQYLEVNDIKSTDDICVLHKDFKGTNTVIDDSGRLAGVFDFVNSNIGERASEFRYFYNPKKPAFLTKMIDEYERISGIRIDMNRIKILCLRDNINGMRNLGMPHLESVRDSAIKSRVERMMFFAK